MAPQTDHFYKKKMKNSSFKFQIMWLSNIKFPETKFLSNTWVRLARIITLGNVHITSQHYFSSLRKHALIVNYDSQFIHEKPYK